MNIPYRDLKVWQRPMKLAVKVYPTAKCFPREELYGLVTQLRRALVSVPNHIAEGKGRPTASRPSLFLFASEGSLCQAIGKM